MAVVAVYGERVSPMSLLHRENTGNTSILARYSAA